MFDPDAAGTRTLALVLAVAVVLAGCAGIGIERGGDLPASDENASGGGTAPGDNRTSLAALPAGGAELSAAERARARALVAGFYDDLPENASERRRTGLAVAGRICRLDRRFGRPPTADALATNRTATNASRRMARAAAALGAFNDRVDPAPVRALATGVDDPGRYVPLVGSYRRLAAASCRASERRTNASLGRFYVAALAFGVEMTLLGAGADPGTAAAAGRAVAGDGRVGLYRIRYLLGNHGYALALSEVHWALHAEMVGVVAYAVRTAASMGVAGSLDGVNFTAVVREQGHDRDRSWLRRCGAVGAGNGNVTAGAVERAIDGEDVEGAIEAAGDAVDDAIGGGPAPEGCRDRPSGDATGGSSGTVEGSSRTGSER